MPMTVALVVVLLSSSLGPGLLHLARRALQNLTARVTTVTTTAPVIVEQLQALNRLETARQISRHEIEARSDPLLPLPAFLVKDRLLMLVQTEVVAGIDLSHLSSGDVQVKDKTLSLRLPAPRLLSVRIQDRYSRVYTRERGWLVFNPDKDLERQARLQAQADARQAALRGEILTAARTNAEKNLTALLQSLGFRAVEFHWAEPTASADIPSAFDPLKDQCRREGEMLRASPSA